MGVGSAGTQLLIWVFFNTKQPQETTELQHDANAQSTTTAPYAPAFTNRTQGAFATSAHLQTTIQRTNTHNITIYATLTQYIAIFMSVVTIPATEKHGSEKPDRPFFFYTYT